MILQVPPTTTTQPTWEVTLFEQHPARGKVLGNDKKRWTGTFGVPGEFNKKKTVEED